MRYLVSGFLISFGSALVEQTWLSAENTGAAGSVNCELLPIRQADLARFHGLPRCPLRGPGTSVRLNTNDERREGGSGEMGVQVW